jgi:bacterioferritin-associated ferredoxin
MRIVRIKMAAMIVCLCHRVSDRDIARAARQGCASFDELQDQTRVGTACGACGDCARETFDAQRVSVSCTAAAGTWIAMPFSPRPAPQPAAA